MAKSSRIIDGLKTNTLYSFYVRAKNTMGSWSDLPTVVTRTTLKDTTTPAVPGAITLLMLAGIFSLKWAKPATLDLRSGGFKVYVFTSNTPASAVLIREVGYTSDSTQILVGEKSQDASITITAGTTYFFWVTTLDASGNESAKVATTPTSGSVSGTYSPAAHDHSPVAHDHTSIDGSGVLTKDEHDDYSQYAGTGTPAAPAAGFLRIYARDTQAREFIDTIGSMGIIIRLGRDNVVVVRGAEAGGIAKGQAVYISGATGNIPQIKLAKADSLTTLPALGMALESIANNAFGVAMLSGRIAGIDVSAFADGAVLYVSAATAGAVTDTPPVTPNYPQRIGIVASSGVSGEVYLSQHAVVLPSGGGGGTLPGVEIDCGSFASDTADIDAGSFI